MPIHRHPDDDIRSVTPLESTEQFAAAKVQRDRAKPGMSEISSTLRRGPDALARLKVVGKGGQDPVNAAFRKAVGG